MEIAQTILHWKRLVIIPVLVGLSLTTSSCGIVHKSVEVERLLSPLADASTPQLVNEVNRLVAARSIHGKVDIQFEDTSFATAGIAEKYRTAEGSITLQRPAKVYLVIQGGVVVGDIAEMTSDGEHFRIAIFKGDEKYHRFVRGTNLAVYPKLDTDGDGNPKKGKSNSEAQTVNALSNLRPQHLTDALLIRPIDLHAPGIVYAESEFYELENDPAHSNKRVVRGYYFLDELQQTEPGSVRLLRRFWFDRVGAIRLTRQQTFDDRGVLVTDVSYGESKKFGDGSASMPIQVGLTRPQDHYKITITYQAPEAVTVDHEYPPEVFVLENKRGLREIDLDAEKKVGPNKN